MLNLIAARAKNPHRADVHGPASGVAISASALSSLRIVHIIRLLEVSAGLDIQKDPSVHAKMRITRTRLRNISFTIHKALITTSCRH